MHQRKLKGTKPAKGARRFDSVSISEKKQRRKSFQGRFHDELFDRVTQMVAAERRAERKKGREKAEKGPAPEETGPDLLSLLRPVGKMHHAALGYIDDDEYGD
jgi:hypothetical protein